jgi:nucleoside-diphosphate-sugar epimerase
VWNFIDAVVKQAGLPPVQKSVPKNFALLVAGLLEIIHRVFRLKSEPFITRFAIHEICTSHWFDISAAKNMLGFSPKVSFEEGLKRL